MLASNAVDAVHCICAIRAGDIVGIGTSDGGKFKQLISGVVARITLSDISVAFEELPEDTLPSGSLLLVKLANDITYKRLSRTINDLASAISASGGIRWKSQPCPAVGVIGALFDSSTSSGTARPAARPTVRLDRAQLASTSSCPIVRMEMSFFFSKLDTQ